MARVKPRARAELEVVEIDGEAVVYDARSDGLHYLNHSSATVFALCDGESTIVDIVEAISDVYELPPDDADKQVRQLVRDLRTIDLLEHRHARGENAPHTHVSDEGAITRIQVPKNT